MTNSQMYIALGIPGLLILANIALTLTLNGRLESRMEARFDKVDGDLRRFFELFGRHDKAIEIFERKL
jgi:hypothetical protein